jgi:hypothetical protein
VQRSSTRAALLRRWAFGSILTVPVLGCSHRQTMSLCNASTWEETQMSTNEIRLFGLNIPGKSSCRQKIDGDD